MPYSQNSIIDIPGTGCGGRNCRFEGYAGAGFRYQMIHLLQVYRGCAAMLVVLFHASARIKKLYGVERHAFLDFFDFGDAGVQFFFVLSGFIIYHIHRNDIGRVGDYLIKRVIRIYPIYIFVTLLILPAWYFLPSIGFPDK